MHSRPDPRRPIETVSVVLLTDPEQRASLAAARALWRTGHRVLTIGASRGLAGVSRAVSRHVPVMVDDARQHGTFAERVAAVVAREQVQVVIPVSDFASASLLGRDAQLGARVAGPTAEAYRRASDKAALLQVAAECGVRVPRQFRLEQASAPLPEAAALQGQMVIKPTRSEISVKGRSQKVGVRFVNGADGVAKGVAGYPAEAYPLLLQERTMGDGIGLFLLRAAGATRLSFAHRRLREKPPAGGVSTYREAIAVPPALQANCEKLLDRLAYEGAAMLEFKHDRDSGEYVLMEINARLWGSLQLAVDAGVDFPSALVAFTLGEPLPPARIPQAGVRTVWEFGEIDHALALARRSRAALHLPPEVAVGPGAALRALFDHRWSDRSEVFRWSDPLPFAAEALRWLRKA